MVKMPVFLTSVVASATRLSRRPAKAWDGEDARLLDLGRGKCNQALKKACARFCLHFMLFSERLDKGALRHDFAVRLRGLHGLHGLHGSHCCENKCVLIDCELQDL